MSLNRKNFLNLTSDTTRRKRLLLCLSSEFFIYLSSDRLTFRCILDIVEEDSRKEHHTSKTDDAGT